MILFGNSLFVFRGSGHQKENRTNDDAPNRDARQTPGGGRRGWPGGRGLGTHRGDEHDRGHWQAGERNDWGIPDMFLQHKIGTYMQLVWCLIIFSAEIWATTLSTDHQPSVALSVLQTAMYWSSPMVAVDACWSRAQPMGWCARSRRTKWCRASKRTNCWRRRPCAIWATFRMRWVAMVLV